MKQLKRLLQSQELKVKKNPDFLVGNMGFIKTELHLDLEPTGSDAMF